MLFVTVLFVICCSLGVKGAPKDAEILQLPGWSPLPLPSKQYSGFVDANSIGNLKMHYWFVESESDPATAPLLLWFNGGPGASSLFGLLVELGPFLVSDISRLGPSYAETKVPHLIYNPYGWQKSANILAFSMPPPVGFSYCTPPGPSAQGNDCGAWNDTSTAEVTYFALKSWLEDFPEYKGNRLYISGESYAGVYVPMLVKQILAHPQDGINLKGFAVGDACTPPDICGDKQSGPYWSIQFLYGKSAFSNQLYEEIMTVCSMEELTLGGLSTTCSASVNKIGAEAGGYWVYGFYDDCWYENDFRRRKLLDLLGNHASTGERPYYGPPIGAARHAEEAAGVSQVGEAIPYSQMVGRNGYACGGASVQIEWLSQPSVREALHIPENATFFQCDNGYDFTYELTEKDLVSWYKQVIAEGKLQILVYNGDTDPCINAYQAQNWTRNMEIPVVQSWRPWTTDGCQNMGGYVTRYANNFDFLTIRGSGHMVPQSRPQVTLEFITRFLSGEDYKHYDASCSAPASTGIAADAAATEAALLAEMNREQQLHERKIASLKGKLAELKKN